MRLRATRRRPLRPSDAPRADRDAARVRRVLRGRRDRDGNAAGAGRALRDLAAARDPAGRAADGPGPPLVAVRRGAAADPRAADGRLQPARAGIDDVRPVRRPVRASRGGRRAAAADSGQSAAARQPAPHGRVHLRRDVPGAVRRPGRGGRRVLRRRLRARLLGPVAAARAGADGRCGHRRGADPLLRRQRAGGDPAQAAAGRRAGVADRVFDRGDAAALRLEAGPPASSVAGHRAVAVPAVVGGSLRPRRAGLAPAGRRAGGGAVHEGRSGPIRHRLGRRDHRRAAGILPLHLHPADAAGGAGMAARAGGGEPAPQPGAVPLGGRRSDRSHLPLPAPTALTRSSTPRIAATSSARPRS